MATPLPAEDATREPSALVAGSHRLARELDSTDRIELAFLGVLFAIALASRPHSLPEVVLAAGAVLLLARWGRDAGRGALVHDISPIVMVIAFFEFCGPLVVALSQAPHDGLLRSIDAHWFGALSAGWRGFLHRPDWLTDAASLAYMSFYVVPMVIALALHRQGRRAEFDRFAFTLTATFLTSYLIYFAFPASGPRVPQALDQQVLGGGLISELVRHFVRATEAVPFDAFPSGHTAGTVVCCVLGARAFPRWTAPILLLGSAIIFSTVYLSYHYVSDVLGGALLASVMLLAAPSLERLVGPVCGEARHGQ